MKDTVNRPHKMKDNGIIINYNELSTNKDWIKQAVLDYVGIVDVNVKLKHKRLDWITFIFEKDTYVKDIYLIVSHYFKTRD